MRFSSLQSTSDCGRDGSLARLSLVSAKAGLRDLERSPRRLLGPGMDPETMIMRGPCLVSGHALRSRGVPGARGASLDRQWSLRLVCARRAFL